jgi:hypothetical protein
LDPRIPTLFAERVDIYVKGDVALSMQTLDAASRLAKDVALSEES